MMKKLGIIHTTPVTVDSLKKLTAEIIPECETINIVDDTILPELIGNSGKIETIKPRWEFYAKVLEAQGANLILSACSSVGPLVDMVQHHIKVPLVRIDEAMAEHAVSHANKIGVAATLETTLEPTVTLLQQKAREKGKAIDIVHEVASPAYQKLIDGDVDGHNQELIKTLNSLLKKTELIVLAQASMARVVPALRGDDQSRVISSPELGIQAVKERLYP